MKNQKEYKVIGMMSGTSMDGLDIAFCSFIYNEEAWSWKILTADTIPYSEAWIARLKGAMHANGEELSSLHIELGAYFGDCLATFIKNNNCRPDLIASHGHTVFHQPENRLTLQIGAGEELYRSCKVPVVCNFRTLDMALGGQGAPLVPAGDRGLFGEFDACLNLGGIANISFEDDGRRIAYDICTCNMTLNHLAAAMNQPYDEDGRIAASGNTDVGKLNRLNALSYYSLDPPKSLGQENVESEVLPVLTGEIPDMLRTSVEHTATQVAASIRKINKKPARVLVTGGGAFNSFLIQRIKEEAGVYADVVIPDAQTIAYKEALVFAFLGVLKMRKEFNVLSSVTGATEDSCSGIIFG